MSKIIKKYWAWADTRQELNGIKYQLEAQGVTNLQIEYRYGPPEEYRLYSTLDEYIEINNNTLNLNSIFNYISSYCCSHK